MKAYKQLKQAEGTPSFTVGERSFYQVELTPEEEATVVDGDLHNKYYVLYEWEFECHADNDGGIDTFTFGDEKIPLSAEESILEDGQVVGFYTYSRVFPLTGHATHAGGRGAESVAGWGDVSSGSDYTLMKK
jgi:hypothetical protein